MCGMARWSARLPPWLDRPLAPALVGLLLGCAVVAVQLSREGGASAFVRAAPAGYDGMFYYRLALDPFTDQRTDFGITFDRPAYRQQRIVYPLLAWILSLGDARRVPWALVLVDLAGLFAVGWIGGALARAAGRHALWGLLFPAYPGFAITLARDLTEIVASAFLLAALLWLRRGHAVRAAGALSLAVLARETTILLALAAGIAALVASPRRLRSWVPLLAPGLVLVAWQLVLLARWHETAASEGATSLAPPLVGIMVAAWHDPERFGPITLSVWAAIVAFVFAMAAVGIRALRAARAPHERWAFYAYLALATILEANIWANGAVLRAVTELAMLTALLAMGASAVLRKSLLGLELALSIVLLASGLRI